MKRNNHKFRKFYNILFGSLVLVAGGLGAGDAAAFELSVVDPQGNPVSGFRWILQEDATLWVEPGVPVSDSIGVNIALSHAPLVATGASAGSTASVLVPDPAGRYFVSVLPDSAASNPGFANGGAQVPPGASAVKVVVEPTPLPTAQISIFVFEDHNSINNAADIGAEAGLPDFKITVHDNLGHAMQDTFGNPIGTEYLRNLDGTFQLDGFGSPIPDPAHMGQGFVTSDADGWAQIKYMSQGKYGVLVTPPLTDPFGNPVHWEQTATIEGTKVIDAWVKPDEAMLYVEGFGTAAAHVSFGFVNPAALPWIGTGPGSATITGRVVTNHFSAPPLNQGYHSGEPVSECWVGLNATSGQGLIALPCASDSTFSIPGVPPGTYELVTWDKPLDHLFGFNTVVVPEGAGTVALGDVLSYRWFGTLEGRVFNDMDQDGFPDPGEMGLSGQPLAIRFRDGRIYQSTVSEPDGSYIFSEVFPFFKWLVAEVGFTTRKATGATLAVDAGGPVQPDAGWAFPSRDKLNPQAQADSNPNTNNNLSRTEIGQVLTEALHLFLGQTNVIDWGKASYSGNENGGLSGIVFYATTRAENDPRFAVGDPWEPGLPRVQVDLYQDSSPFDGVIDDLDGSGGVTLADVDNYPRGWEAGGTKGSEDVDRNGNGTWDPGDALNSSVTDSFDDAQPSGCIQHELLVHDVAVPECYDNFGTWNQIRPGVFDGGYSFQSYFPGGMASGSIEAPGLPSGYYIVAVNAPPGYLHQKEEDKNVDFGSTYVPSMKDGTGDPPELLPAPCVGDLHTVPATLTLFPDEATPAPFAGASRPLCDRKEITLLSGQNGAADFFLFTEVPAAAQAVGFVNNDLTAEFNIDTPNFGEKAAPSWIPISFQDWAGNEVARVYTDEFGTYNALLPSTFTVNTPSPTGVSPTILTAYLNHPFMKDPGTGLLVPDPYYDPDFSQSVWTFDVWPAATSYLDTPLVPVGAFVGYPNRNLDLESADMIPGIATADGDLPSGGPAVCGIGATITISSVGLRQVPNPDYNPALPGSQPVIIRNNGFGSTIGRVTLAGIDLPVTSWSDSAVQATVPAGSATGQLLIQRGDNLQWSETGLTIHVGACGAAFVPIDYPTIQAAIDAAAPGGLIIVKPGTYTENPIMWKPVRLQGSGAESTRIFATPIPADRLQTWHDTVQAIRGNDPFAGMEAPGLMVFGDSGMPFTGFASLIDGFFVTGSISGGGIYVYNEANGLELSNNVIRSNQGTWGGGITVGIFDVPTGSADVFIHHNRIVKNGAIDGGGGVTLYAGSIGYRVIDNVISGNLSRFYGGGILHYGMSDGGLIASNQLLFNEVMWGGGNGGDGGGIFVGGLANGTLMSDGSGTLTIDSNRIQGNLAGSGSGGGIRLAQVNGTDVATLPESQWHTIKIFNNLITNNAAAVAGGGIAVQDAAKAFIINNTIADNDSTATGASAFPPGDMTLSVPQIAGVATEVHSAQLQAAFPVGLEQQYSDPVLANNIITFNRSFYFDGSLNSGKGGLAPRPLVPTWDLGVAGVDPTQVLHPFNSVLTDATGFDPSNVSGDPLLLGSHLNSLVTAVVLDEGGNRITVRYTPLVVGATEYLLDPSLIGSAFALGDGSWEALFPELLHDIQGDPRSTWSTEAGADELIDLIGDVNCDGVVNGLDAVQIVKVILNGPTVCSRENLDGAGTIDAADLAAFINLGW